MTNTLAYCDTELCGVFVGGSTLTVTKTLAYCDKEFITTVKKFYSTGPRMHNFTRTIITAWSIH